MTVQHGQSSCVSLVVLCDSEQTQKATEEQIVLKRTSKSTLCAHTEEDEKMSLLCTGTVVTPWTTWPGCKLCVSEPLPYEESEQRIESLPAPGLLLFNWPHALMFLLQGGKQNSEISPWTLWINTVFRKAEESGQFRNKKNHFEIHTAIENYNNWLNITFQSVWQHADVPYNLSQSALHFISVCFISDTCQLKHCNPHEYSLRAVYCMM